jgi:hypothetical protein
MRQTCYVGTVGICHQIETEDEIKKKWTQSDQAIQQKGKRRHQYTQEKYFWEQTGKWRLCHTIILPGRNFSGLFHCVLVISELYQ